MQYKIALVGEAYGAEEEKARAPFIGASGYELTRMLDEAGIRRADCFLTNVFNLRPKDNDLENICTDKAGGLVQLGPLKAGKYLRPEYASELERLYNELKSNRGNVTLLLGGTACWAILGSTGISKIRGTVTSGQGRYTGFKVVPAYHPAAVLRDWSLRPVTVLDLAKARRESEFPEIRLPQRTVYIEPDLNDMEWFFNEHLINAERISVDIETRGKQITCIGFGPTKSVSMVVPLVDERKPGNCYWPTHEQEVRAWQWIQRVLLLPAKKDGQNFLYDLNFLLHYGFKINNPGDDSMLAHHSLQPESEKGLAFLGSVYTSEASWKLRFRNATIKRDA